jgi:hypothetical protein
MTTASATPHLERAIALLTQYPRGLSRGDLLAAMHLHDVAWPELRRSLEACRTVTAVGRGPGLRFVHAQHLQEVPSAVREQRAWQSRQRALDHARSALRALVQSESVVNSQLAQTATGLDADNVRRLLLELVDEGALRREGSKRATRYLRASNRPPVVGDDRGR